MTNNETRFSSGSPGHHLLLFVQQVIHVPLILSLCCHIFMKLSLLVASKIDHHGTQFSESMSGQVDLDNINVNEFPRTGDVEFMDGILEEGDLLYIPPKWWHYVRSLSTSFSVSFWWRTSIPPPQGS
jgi:hypothetical protein